MRNFGIQTRIHLAFLVIIIILIIIGGIGCHTLKTIDAEYSESITRMMTISDLENEASTVKKDVELISSRTTTKVNNRVIIISSLTIFSVIISGILGLALSKSILDPLKKLLKASTDLASGKLDADVGSHYKDEVAGLSNAMKTVVITIKALIEDIESLNVKIHVHGDVDAQIDSSRFQGSYKTVSEGINDLVGGMVEGIRYASTNMQALALGDFDSIELRELPGKKMVLTNATRLLLENLNSIVSEIKTLINASNDGDLNKRINSSKYENSWHEIAEGLNSIMDSMVAPLNDTIGAAEEMAKGNLSAHIDTKYKGDYLRLKTSINNTLTSMSNFIKEISGVLNEMSHENFDMEITASYIGDFAPIKESLIKIIDSFNLILSEIHASTEQISTGARQISESSMSLAQGATEQSASVDELVSRLSQITVQTQENSQSSMKANDLANEAKQKALVGSNEMKKMLDSMRGINDASINISKIIKVIDDIAFQTNLLALNAAVEAARAGQQGKGFAVVAEEVRALAARSKNAAQETTVLIKSSVNSIGEGSKMANQTASTLEEIVEQITSISELTTNVAIASNKQEQDINHINDGINIIFQVTQSNTATSEEQAAAAQELSSQSEVFKSMVARFKLKDHNSYYSTNASYKDTIFKDAGRNNNIVPATSSLELNSNYSDMNLIEDIRSNDFDYNQNFHLDNSVNSNITEDNSHLEDEFMKSDFGKY